METNIKFIYFTTAVCKILNSEKKRIRITRNFFYRSEKEYDVIILGLFVFEIIKDFLMVKIHCVMLF
jgi:hypothetical protein